jgi:hypothetical protein
MSNKNKENTKTSGEPISSILRKNIKKHKRILLAISLVAFLIILIHLPKITSELSIKHIGGAPMASMGSMGSMGMGSMASMGSFGGMGGDSGGNSDGDSGKKKSKLSFSPMTSGVNMMWWATKNILLFYLFLLFITVVPSLPIIAYITVFYFIISSLIGRIQTL